MHYFYNTLSKGQGFLNEKRYLNKLMLITEFLRKSEMEFNVFLYSE